MKLKSILGTFVALGAMVLMAVGVQAATYSAGTVSGTAGNDVVVPVQVTPDDSETIKVNAYAMSFTYDSTLVTPKAVGEDVLGEDCYAAVGDSFDTENSIIVSDIITDGDTTKLIVAWAAAEPVEVSSTDAVELANVTFTVADDAASDIPVTIAAATVATASEDGSTVTQADVDSTSLVAGTINLASALDLGDVNGDGSIDGTDVTLLKQIVNNVVTVSDLEGDGYDYPTGVEDRSDVNEDASVDGTDVTLLKQYVNNVISAFK